MNKVDLSNYQNALSRKNQIARFLWTMVWAVFARPMPMSLGKQLEAFFASVVWS
jgi:putative colanic acid biosynthesis acetyltransferase WcaF